MAYNGGATAATVDTIQHEEKWSPAGIGLLGADFWIMMDLIEDVFLT